MAVVAVAKLFPRAPVKMRPLMKLKMRPRQRQLNLQPLPQPQPNQPSRNNPRAPNVQNAPCVPRANRNLAPLSLRVARLSRVR